MKPTFNYSFAFWLIIFILFSYVVLSYIPDFYLEKYQTSVYMESGQIGDIVGGTTNPIIAIVAAFLTFLAFWMQYRANKQQRGDISIERFENNLYEMLHLHRENVLDLSCGNRKGRDAVFALCYKLKILYFLTDGIVESLVKEDKAIFYKYCHKNEYSYTQAKNVIACNLLFYGANISYAFDDTSDERKLYDKLSRIIENFESNRTIVSIDGAYNEDTFSILSDNLSIFLNDELTLDDVDRMLLPDSLLCGHKDKFGIYYRQLYQIAKFIALKDGISEQKRYEYMRILRSQLSDYEQILLYYNTLIDVGKAWDECLIAKDMLYSNIVWVKFRSCFFRLKQDWNDYLSLANRAHKETGVNKFKDLLRRILYALKEEWKKPTFILKVPTSQYWKCNMGLLARFCLIKNIPVSFKMFGYIPDSKYLHEIVIYKKHGDNFFESKDTVIFAND